MTKVKFEWLPECKDLAKSIFGISHFPQKFFGTDRCKKIWKGMIRYAQVQLDTFDRKLLP